MPGRVDRWPAAFAPGHTGRCAPLRPCSFHARSILRKRRQRSVLRAAGQFVQDQALPDCLVGRQQVGAEIAMRGCSAMSNGFTSICWAANADTPPRSEVVGSAQRLQPGAGFENSRLAHGERPATRCLPVASVFLTMSVAQQSRAARRRAAFGNVVVDAEDQCRLAVGISLDDTAARGYPSRRTSALTRYSPNSRRCRQRRAPCLVDISRVDGSQDVACPQLARAG